VYSLAVVCVVFLLLPLVLLLAPTPSTAAIGIVFRAHLCEEVDVVLYSLAVVCVVFLLLPLVLLLPPTPSAAVAVTITSSTVTTSNLG
jgi:hypothetical protein